MFERRRTAMAAEHAVVVRLLPPQAIHPGFSQLPRPDCLDLTWRPFNELPG